MTKATLHRDHVADRAAQGAWRPFMRKHAPRDVTFTFDHDANLLDHDAPEEWDDMFVVTLMRDARAAAFPKGVDTDRGPASTMPLAPRYPIL